MQTLLGGKGWEENAMNASEIPKFKREFWKALAGNYNRGLIGMIIARFVGGRNYKGEQFAPYAKGYEEAKSTGSVSGLGGQRQESTSSTPDMTLTGKMRKGLKRYGLSDSGVVIGWIGPNAAKVQSLHDHNNYQILGLDGDQVFADEEETFINSEISTFYDKKLKAYTKDDLTFKLGK